MLKTIKLEELDNIARIIVKKTIELRGFCTCTIDGQKVLVTE